MKRFLNKEFCLWVVPARDGKVRKLRITGRRTLVIALGILISAGLVAFVMGDYARVQIARAKHFFALKYVTAQRDQLAGQNHMLSEQVKELEESNSRVLSYEQGVKLRIEELVSLIEGAGMLGVFEANRPKTKSEGEGVGGLETECSNPFLPGCTFSSNSKNMPADALKLSSRVSGSQDLVEVLDNYITIVKALPLGIPGNGHISSPFGPRVSPFSKKVKLHQGMDFSLPLGGHIFSTGDGIVKSVKRTKTYGLMVDIAHNSRIVTRYAHLSKAFVSAGEKICKGEVLGLAGSTGRSTGPHLHYEVRLDGKPQNPMRYLTLASRLSKLL